MFSKKIPIARNSEEHVLFKVSLQIRLKIVFYNIFYKSSTKLILLISIKKKKKQVVWSNLKKNLLKGTCSALFVTITLEIT